MVLASPSLRPQPSPGARRHSLSGCCPLDSFTILFWRGFFAGSATVVLLLLVQGRSGLTDLTRMNRGGLLFAVLSATGMLLFIPALAADQRRQRCDHHGDEVPIRGGHACLGLVREGSPPPAHRAVARAIAALGVATSVGGASAGSDVERDFCWLCSMTSWRWRGHDRRCAALSRHAADRRCRAFEFPREVRQACRLRKAWRACRRTISSFWRRSASCRSRWA